MNPSQTRTNNSSNGISSNNNNPTNEEDLGILNLQRSMEDLNKKESMTRKRAFTTMMETMENSVVKVRKMIRIDPECEDEFHNIAKSMANMACVYKENEHMHRVVVQHKVRDLRTKALMKCMCKKIDSLNSALHEAKTQLQTSKNQAEFYANQLHLAQSNQTMYHELLHKLVRA
jgi:hypothetical protein